MKSENKNKGSIREKTVGRFYSGLRILFYRVQRSWANWMNSKTSGLSRKTLYISLFLFVAFSVTYNSMILIGTDRSEKMGFGKIKLPNKLTQPKILDDAYTTEIRRIKRFTRFMDSLSRSPTGKVTYDSIMIARPGLLDSARAMEKLFDKF